VEVFPNELISISCKSDWPSGDVYVFLDAYGYVFRGGQREDSIKQGKVVFVETKGACTTRAAKTMLSEVLSGK
jgi:hypothetical protein